MRLQKLRDVLLPNRDARITNSPDADASALSRVEILADTTAGWELAPRAAETLAEQVRQQRGAYNAEQQRVLSTLLESTFIEHLKERLDHTAETFRGINRTLARHPTRYGHTVRLMWNADPSDADARAVVTALEQSYDQLGPQRQEMIRAFLARRIDEARDEITAGGDWKEHLAAALDYRNWLRISLEYRTGTTGQWRPFDAARHGAKSGGEKVVLLSQPLFAAAVVAYDAAGPYAPRCVWLDEAMTGVDAEVKASFMGLTVDLDLDVMLTAHDEWCQYETVPAVAVYDLARHRHFPGVDVMPYLWCGGKWTTVDTPRLGPTPPQAPPPENGLF